MLSAITWLYLYPLTSNSRSPEGKSHLKRSVDQKVVLQPHIVKLIILGSKYWGLHAHLSQSVFIYWAHLCKMSIYPYENSFVSVASCSSSQQYFCAQISHPQIKLSSVWKAHEANKQGADHLTPDKAPPLHPNTKSSLLISCQRAEEEGQWPDFSFWKAATIAFDPAAIIIPQAILSWTMPISCPFHCF